MAEVATGEKNLLMSKWGPLPVWVWGAIGLLLAWAFAKYRDLQAAAQETESGDSTGDAGTDAASEPSDVAPQWIIYNQLPTTDVNVSVPGGGPAPSVPVPATPGTPPLVVTPPGTGTKPPTTPGKPPPSRPVEPSPKAKSHKVVAGDTLSGIARKYKVSGGWKTLWAYNTKPGNRPSETIRKLKARGPNLLYSGETILIPPTSER